MFLLEKEEIERPGNLNIANGACCPWNILWHLIALWRFEPQRGFISLSDTLPHQELFKPGMTRSWELEDLMARATWVEIKYIYISNFALGCQTKTLKHLSKKIKFLFLLFNFSLNLQFWLMTKMSSTEN